MSVKDYPSQEQYGRHGYVILPNSIVVFGSEASVERDYDSYILIRDCMMCGMEARIKVPAQGLWDWEHGKHVQDAFPEFTPDERELVMTGIHADCWIPDEDMLEDEDTPDMGVHRFDGGGSW